MPESRSNISFLRLICSKFDSNDPSHAMVRTIMEQSLRSSPTPGADPRIRRDQPCRHADDDDLRTGKPDRHPKTHKRCRANLDEAMGQIEQLVRQGWGRVSPAREEDRTPCRVKPNSYCPTRATFLIVAVREVPMARKQSDYLAALLADEPAETDTGAPPCPAARPNGRVATTLLNREICASARRQRGSATGDAVAARSCARADLAGQCAQLPASDRRRLPRADQFHHRRGRAEGSCRGAPRRTAIPRMTLR